ncbi:AtpZ/AtpI family protein [Rhodanobacter sp. AS-Z3]|uniref:AtpZ/AtpI family protein n=1 Tax=Rhodanobacter sp. AS-Z3 TaxID=3031330 RepID=UPI00247B1930|nr:AtpZ/AtpI family protein [Rhodanobacter sp. AS-Z3]WEN16571.1 AtpZ/AtpI family protein [Rhodanobacter sp. AS-Z3]
MNDEQESLPPDQRTRLDSELSRKIARKLRVQREGKLGVWSGLGMFGLVGWSVAVPTTIGALLGMWWDHRHPGPHSWTLALLVAGLVIGCVNAWHWIAQEDKAMHDQSENDDE